SMEVYFYHVPGLKVVRPSTRMDAKGLLKAAIRDDNPVVFIESETLYAVKGEVPEDPDFVIPLGEAIVRREGRDVTVVAYMGMMYRALEAAEELEKEGISVEIVDPRTLRPMDAGTIIGSVRKTHRAVVVEAGAGFAGMGSEIAAFIMEEAFGAGVLRKILVGAGDRAPVGSLIAVIAEPNDDIASLISGAAPPASAAGKPAGQASAPGATSDRPTSVPLQPRSEDPAARQPAPAKSPDGPGAGSRTETRREPAPGPSAPVMAPVAAAAPLAGARVKASPLAKKVAAQRGVDLKVVQGSGPGGRIIRRDVEAATTPPAAAPAVA